MSPLFKKKEKPTAIPVLEERPREYTLESVERRILLLLKTEKKIDLRMARFEGSINDIQQHSTDILQEIRRELQEIKEQHKLIRNQFNDIIKGVSLTAKKEDFDKTKRIIDQYDFVDMITRDEFKRMME